MQNTRMMIVAMWMLLPALYGGEKPGEVERMMYAGGEVLIVLRENVEFSEIRHRGLFYGMEVKQSFPELSRLTGREHLLLRLPEAGGEAELRSVEALSREPGVAHAELNRIRRLARIPNDPFFHHQWGLRNNGGAALIMPGLPGADIRAEHIWDSVTGSPDMVVAIIDTGVDYRHPDLVANLWRNPGEIPGNHYDDDGNGYPDDIYGYDFAADLNGNDDADPMDVEVHGTHVAGIIAAAGDNGVGVSGVCWNASVMAVKAFRPTSPEPYIFTSDEAQAFEYIIKMKTRFGVNIVAINCSYSGETATELEKDAVVAAGKAGILVCAAMGNDGKDLDSSPQYPAAYTDLAHVVAVAATNPRDELADFSNFGVKTADMAAPGHEILSTAPLGQGDGTAFLEFNGEQLSAISMTYSGHIKRFSQSMVYCMKGLSAVDFPAGITGKIALIERGGGTFAQKTLNAVQAGAAAVVIFNDQEGIFAGTLGGAGTWPPVLSVSRETGLKLVSAGSLPVIMENEPGDYLFSSGTSMSAPLVSGAVALLAARFPQEDWRMRFFRILLNLRPLPALLGRVRTGGRLSLDFPSLQGPLALTGSRSVNRSLFFSQYIHILSWRDNPQNAGADVQKYRVFQFKGKNILTLAEIPAGSAAYGYNHIVGNGAGPFLYAVAAVAGDGSVGEPSLAAIN